MNLREGFKAGIITPILLIVVFGLILAANYIPDRILGINQNPYIIVVIITILTYAIPTVFYRYIRGADFTQRMRISLFGTQHILYLFHASIFMLSGVVLVSMVMYNISPEAFSASSVSEYAAFAMNDRFFDTLYIINILHNTYYICEVI